MAEQLNNTVAIITGASSGIGQAVAIRLAAAGAQVVLVARRKDLLEKLEQQIKAAGGIAYAIDADITSSEAADKVIAHTIEKFGRLDTLVNSAGVMLNGPSITAPLSEWDQMVNINLRGLMYITKAALPYLLAAVSTSARKVADVVNISSVAGRVATATVAIYNATKFAVTAATEAWRQEFTKQSLRFSVVEPGATATALFEQKEGQWEGFKARFGDLEQLHAEDIAEAVAYIVTNPRRIAINEIVIRPTDQA
ncbi:NADP-dependent 3-hydroxy acid dehydrogenase YdfG [Chitinophaga costaii]|uniref:NADP-dependent 3-hydroxy acid dehydrogenase YdfG n=1 Tax=Chitinophaga costaii TaxID=1335309 RepID=A0A1C3YSE6_9BACT|nr:SDR family NAD(P)-dependent oxidoreductase [Chitinophaga costaii]PUZ30085.1 KR domain-containing protein [Chitinophaga costaii]SCB72990.1 NADP-dependent 3-hydroxy acid dehydrogenase YdfG [Chitinophaga costaii]